MIIGEKSLSGVVIKQYNADLKKEWNNFIQISKNGIFMLERDFMDYHSDRFTDNSLMFYKNNELVAVLPASIHDDELCSHGGLTFGGFISGKKMRQSLMLECFECLKTYMREHNIKRIIYKAIPHIYHNEPAEEDLYALFFNNAEVYKCEPSTTIQLDKPYKISRGRKGHISKAKKYGVVVTKSQNFENYIFIVNYVLQKYHKASAVHTGEELKLLKSRFPKNIELYVAKLDNKIIAGTLLFIYDNLVHTQYLAADDTAREIGALDLVISELLSIYKDKKYFDFGISTENNGRYLNQGLIQQKEGFGGRIITYNTYMLTV